MSIGGFYAANLAISRGYPKNETNDHFLLALFDDLEDQKGALSDNPVIVDDEQSRAYILQFSMKVFLAADNEDRAGQASKKTARMFLVAGQFLECMRAFGEPPHEIEERIKYAKWKAMDIIKAINEGRQPQPGPPGADDNAEARLPPTQPTAMQSVSPPTQQMTPPTQSPPPVVKSPPASYPPPVISPPPSAKVTSPPPTVTSPPPTAYPPPPVASSVPVTTSPNLPSFSGNYSSAVEMPFDPKMLSEAERHARFIVSAIQFEDIDEAIKQANQTMVLLQRLKQHGK